LDRIDLHVEVTPVSYEELPKYDINTETSASIRYRVLTARKIQTNCFSDYQELHCNAQVPGKMVRELCQLNEAGMILLKKAMEKLQLSARAYDRILKVARTAADMDGSDNIKTEHVAQAIQYRQLDREGWLG